MTTVNTNMNLNSNSAYYSSSGTVENASLSDSQLMLKMLAVSLQNQDPLNPTDSSEFTNQMTQYATIETLTSVQNSIKELVVGIEQMTDLALSTNLYMVLNNAQSLELSRHIIKCN